MRTSRQRTTTWALAFILGVLSTGDRAFHALAGLTHSEAVGAVAADPGRELMSEVDGNACPACGFFGQAQVDAEPPRPLAEVTTAPSSVQPGRSRIDRAVAPLPPPRGPPIPVRD